MDRAFGIIGALSGLLAVACGAFGAHALKERLAPDALQVWETAARYQMYHALALIGIALLLGRGGNPWAVRAGWGFVVGTLLFSGSLYALAWTGIRGLGAVTPLGGVAFIAGWLMLALAFRQD
jgi:uncharacterized membrane protein YgdD (TMEM256/DUF423 family)